MSFPNLKKKHGQKSLVSPQELIKYKRKTRNHFKFKAPEGTILCYQKSLFEYVLKNQSHTKVAGFYGEMYLLKGTKKRIGVLGNFGIGAPIAAAHLEELIAMGSKKFVSIGTAGTLQKERQIGDIVVCEKAIRDEGTSHHYLKPSKYAYASKKMTKKIQQSLEELGQPYSIGASWTMDAPYRETIAEAKKYQKEGIATVEMEASALFAVAQYRKAELGAIFTISDSLAELTWKPHFNHKKTQKSLETIFDAALKALQR